MNLPLWQWIVVGVSLIFFILMLWLISLAKKKNKRLTSLNENLDKKCYDFSLDISHAQMQVSEIDNSLKNAQIVTSKIASSIEIYEEDMNHPITEESVETFLKKSKITIKSLLYSQIPLQMYLSYKKHRKPNIE